MAIRRIKRIYLLVMFLFWFATGLRAVLVVLLMQERGINLFQIGLLIGAYSLTVVLLELPTGGLADAVGRKRVSLLAYTLNLLTAVVFLLAFSFPAFLLAWLLAGVGRALSSGALDAWFVDSLQEADPAVDIQPALANAGTVIAFALGAGTLIGGAIPRLFAGLPADGTAVLTPLAMPVLFAIGVELILLMVVALLVREERPLQGWTGWRDGFGQVSIIVGDALQLSRRNPTVMLLLGASLATGMALSSMESFWQPHFAVLLGGTVENSYLFGIIMAGNFLISMAGNLLSTPLSRLLRKRYALVAAVAQGMQGFLLILLALQTSTIPAVSMFWLVYLTLGVLHSPQTALLNQEIPAARRSSMLSVFSLAGYMGGFIGGAVLGFVAERASISLAWILAGALLMVSLFLFLNIDRRQERRVKDDAETSILESR